MNTLITFLRYDMLSLLAALFLIVGFRLVTGRINTYKLIQDKVTKKLSPGRLQMLIITLSIAIYYVTLVIQKGEFPTLPQEYVLALVGSHLFYLGGKTYGVLARKLELAATRLGRMNQ